jgi:large subunit ribosomal protein L21e
MSANKRIREKGKISLSRYFQQFKPGDLVAVDIEQSEIFGYPNKLQGRTGKVIEKRGSAFHIEINDLNKAKRYLIKPIHLKKIEAAK